MGTCSRNGHRALFLLLLAFSLGACTSKKTSEPKMKFIYMGDPMNMVKSTALNRQVDLSLFQDGERLALFQGYQVMDMEAAQANPKNSQESVEEANRPEEEYNEGPSADIFTVHRMGNDVRLSGRIDGELTNIIITNHADAEGQVVEDPDDFETRIHLIHFSQTEDGKIISLLLRSENNGHSGLTGLWFSRSLSAGDPIKTSEPYNYILGRGIKAGWKRGSVVTMTYAADTPSFMKAIIQSRVKEWAAELSPNLTFEAREVKAQAPFTDLNSHGVYLIADKMVSPYGDIAGYGNTMNTYRRDNFDFVDSDVFLYEKEFAKTGVTINDYRLLPLVEYTILHELGHVLGLHHIFDGTDSVMSYEYKAHSLTEYDKKAIHALYGSVGPGLAN